MPKFSPQSGLKALLLYAGVFVFSVGCHPAPTSRPVSVGPYNIAGSPPHLLAHYLPWFEDGTAGKESSQWDHWKWKSERADHDPEQKRADGLRDLATVQYPLIGPYSSGDPAVVRYHCETARAAGIEGLIVLWYGPGSATDTRIPLILEEAARAGLRVALCYEEKLNWPPYRIPATRQAMVETAKEDLTSLIKSYAGHPAYLQRDGKPVVFQFNFWGTDRLGPRTFSPAEWKTIFDALPQPVCYVRQNFDPAYHPAIAGSYHWWTDQDAVLKTHQERVIAARASGELVFHAGMIAPGFDDAGTDGWGGGRRTQARNGTDTLQKSFAAALVGDPEIIQIVTWNDFNEGTEVEPTVERGFTDLQEIGNWWAGVKETRFDTSALKIPLRKYLDQLSPESRREVPAEAFRQTGTAP